jgi:type VI secretion system secreted protein VgrG
MTTDDILTIRIEASGFASDRLWVRKLSGRERVSELFDFEVEIVSLDEGGPEPSAMIGASVALVFTRGKTEIRRIWGMIAEARDFLDSLTDHRSYRLRVVPRAFRLSLIENQETFLHVTIPALIQQKLELVGLSGADVELRLFGSYPEREFVVQYKETDLAFVCRLAEHLGISFFFEHQDGTDKMVFTDQASGFQPAPGAEEIRFRARGEERDVYELESVSRVGPSVFVVRDYNYRTPLVDLTAETTIPEGFAGGVIEYGDHYQTPAEGQHLAQVRSEERQSTQQVYEGKSTLCPLLAGGRSTLDEHPHLGSVPMLIVEVEHRAVQPLSGGDRSSYTNTFRGVPAATTFRPPRRTPRPQIAGFVTAIVDAGTGDGSAYAEIDPQGRYMVRFLFDSAASGGRLASRPVRMLQNHAGENYGTHFPLKPGIEVLVGFVNGDPDRPVIVGAVPNPLTPSPVDARNRTMHRIQTRAGIKIELVDE